MPKVQPGMKKNNRYVSPQIKVEVSAETISTSRMASSSHCMIAEAIKQAVPVAAYVSVDLATIRFTDPEKGLRYTYLTPRAAQLALLNFDSGQLPEPFSFNLRTAAQVRRSGWKAAHPNTERRSDLDKGKLRVKSTGQSKVTVVGSTLREGRAIPKMGARRGFGLRAFVLGDLAPQSK